MTDDLVAKLRDEDSYYRLQEKHWCIDAEELERQRLAAADRIEALEAKLAEKDALLRECGEALDGMLEYSMFNEAWQDKHPEYRTKAATTLAKIKDATDG